MEIISEKLQMENPSTWSPIAKAINEAHFEWELHSDYHWSSIGVFIESKLKEAGLILAKSLESHTYEERQELDRWDRIDQRFK
jgi:hypothetical protein